ncbi:MAG: sensor signal transduction histidine kinase [Acidobacteria bacterium]|nr:sensor signal transduction histidine kinase [Acidobacteriota bacterium]
MGKAKAPSQTDRAQRKMPYSDLNGAASTQKGEMRGRSRSGNHVSEKISALAAENRRLVAERQRLYEILDGLPAFVCMLTSDGTLRYINRSFRDLFGKLDGRICYESLLGYIKPCEDCQTLRVFDTKTPAIYHWTALNGRVYEVYDSPFNKKNSPPQVLKMGIDITERERIEGELRGSERKLRQVSLQLLTVQEEERRRISMELHEELGQALTIMKMKVGLINKGLRADQENLKEECANALRYADQVLTDVRRLSLNLRPSGLEALGLWTTLRRLAEAFSEQTGFKVELLLSKNINELFPKDTQITLFRIFQEALTNIGRHAQAQNVTLSMQIKGRLVHFMIRDDGVGFDPEQLQRTNTQGRGIGLAIMKERAGMLGGSFKLHSEAGKGTCITISIPSRDSGVR